jgi:hypothetical protein
MPGLSSLANIELARKHRAALAEVYLAVLDTVNCLPSANAAAAAAAAKTAAANPKQAATDHAMAIMCVAHDLLVGQLF